MTIPGPRPSPCTGMRRAPCLITNSERPGRMPGRKGAHVGAASSGPDRSFPAYPAVTRLDLRPPRGP